MFERMKAPRLHSADGTFDVLYDKDAITDIIIRKDLKGKPVDLNTVKGIKKMTAIDQYFDIESDEVISDLIIPDFISDIGEAAFCRNRWIKRVRWPSGCQTIKAYMFKGSALESVYNIEHIVSIGMEAFCTCKNLTSFKIPLGVTEIPSRCFSASNLAEIDGLDRMEYIANEAFSSTNIKRINWPSKCHCIFPYTFSGCHVLKIITGLENVVCIKNHAFFRSGIETLDLSNSLCCCIEYSAFAESNLTNFKPGFYLRKIGDLAFSETIYEKRGG